MQNNKNKLNVKNIKYFIYKIESNIIIIYIGNNLKTHYIKEKQNNLIKLYKYNCNG